MTPSEEIRLICETLNPGGQSKLARMLDSHIPGKNINPRTVRGWISGRSKPHPLLMEKIREIGRREQGR